jgi:hypothetical protein
MHQATEYSNKSDPVKTKSTILSILTILGKHEEKYTTNNYKQANFNAKTTLQKLVKICEILQISKHLHAYLLTFEIMYFSP